MPEARVDIYELVAFGRPLRVAMHLERAERNTHLSTLGSDLSRTGTLNDMLIIHSC